MAQTQTENAQLQALGSLLESIDKFGHHRLYTSFVILACILLRYATGGGSWSGYQTPPKYGDFEAQRHWMEITVNLPVTGWYTESYDNDLDYWGIDYPPLSAYTAWALGKVAEYLTPETVEIQMSRGSESEHTRLFMRTSVIVLDALVFFTAIYAFWKRYLGEKRYAAVLAGFSLVLLQPAFILIDHGHFQYNCVALGLVVWSLLAFDRDWDMAGSILFCLAIGFKVFFVFFFDVVNVLIANFIVFCPNGFRFAAWKAHSLFNIVDSIFFWDFQAWIGSFIHIRSFMASLAP
jgi:alpha-1,3-glucosyltransferase